MQESHKEESMLPVTAVNLLTSCGSLLNTQDVTMVEERPRILAIKDFTRDSCEHELQCTNPS